jgi:hypothetical protein
MTRHVEVDTALWDQFHRVVNMTSRELMDWLHTLAAEPRGQRAPIHLADAASG